LIPDGCSNTAPPKASRPPPTINDPSQFIVVDSRGDKPDANVGDGICADQDGSCTLRAALEEANNEAAETTIQFRIPVAESFTRDGRVTLQPRTVLPLLNSQIFLDGYTQPGASMNTAPSPLKFNGNLVISIDGSKVAGESANGLVLTNLASGSWLRGVAIGGFSGDAINLGKASDVKVAGSYIGTDHTGIEANRNGGSGIVAERGRTNGSKGIQVGGSRPSERNVISGNDDNAAYPLSGWTISGNYIGVAADGSTAIPNGTSSASAGALSIDDASDVVVGGDRSTDANVISGNASYGIAPDATDRLYIGQNYIGDSPESASQIGNGNVGIIMSRSMNARITGNRVMYNRIAGVLISGSRSIKVGGSDKADRNTIGGNQLQNIAVWASDVPNSGIEIQGNLVGIDSTGNPITGRNDTKFGVSLAGDTTGTLIGGSASGDGNQFGGNSLASVAEMCLISPLLPDAKMPKNTAVAGNSFSGAGWADSDAAPIIRLDATDESSPPDYLADRYKRIRSETSSAACVSQGPPRVSVLGSAVVSEAKNGRRALTLAVVVDSDATRAEEYRVDVFASSLPIHPKTGSEYQFVTAASFAPKPGGGGSIEISLPTDLRGTSIALSVTPIDPASPSGYGATSEISRWVPISE
jgi:CSLREA domain-containing protein